MEEDFTTVIRSANPENYGPSMFVSFVKAKTPELALDKACDMGEGETGIPYVGVAVFNGVKRTCIGNTFDWR